MDGGCLCGAIRYRAGGPARRVTHCHCIHCRRAAGAPFVTWAEFDPASFEFVQGEPGEYESRPKVTRQFCRECGTQLTYHHADDPGTVDVTAASLDDPDAVTPEDHVWCDRMISWTRPGDDLPRFGLSRRAEE